MASDAHHIVHSSANTTAKLEDEGETTKCHRDLCQNANYTKANSFLFDQEDLLELKF